MAKDLLRRDLQVLVKVYATPAIQEFIYQIPEEDWEDFESLHLDESITERTKYLLRYLTEVFSDCILGLLKNLKYKYDDLKAIFGNLVSQAFTQAMGIEENIQAECTHVFNMLSLKHVISVVTSPMDEEDSIAFLKLGLGLSSLVEPVIGVVQELMTMSCNIEELRKSYEEQRKDTIRLFAKLLMYQGIRESKTCCRLECLRERRRCQQSLR